MEQKPMDLLKQEAPQLEAILSLNAIEGVDVKTLVLQELEYLRMHAVTKPEIFECIGATVVMAVKSVLKQNLSMDPNAGLVYVKTRNVGIMQNGVKVYKKALEIMPSANGIISINRQCGRILDLKNPTVQKDADGKVISVTIEFMVPSTPAPRWESRTFDESDFYRWRRASHKENGRNKADANIEKLNYANENYTNWKGGIDPEFARAKAVRHGLKKLGTNQNEGKFSKIVIPAEAKTVIIEPAADAAATNDDSVTYTEVIEETPSTPAFEEKVINANDL